MTEDGKRHRRRQLKPVKRRCSRNKPRGWATESSVWGTINYWELNNIHDKKFPKVKLRGMFTWAETGPVRRQRGRTGEGSGISNMSLNQVPRGFDGQDTTREGEGERMSRGT
jgi:hypothetical protein